MEKKIFVEFALSDGDERPSDWREISRGKASLQGKSCEHVFTFYVCYSPFKFGCKGLFEARLAWDGITQLHQHVKAGIQAFEIQADDQIIIGCPSPVVEFDLPKEVSLESFLEGWEITCSPLQGFYYEDWSGYRRVLDEQEIIDRELAKVFSDSLVSSFPLLCRGDIGSELSCSAAVSCSVAYKSQEKNSSYRSDAIKEDNSSGELVRSYLQAVEILSKSDSESTDVLELFQSQIDYVKEYGKSDQSSIYDLFDYLDETNNLDVIEFFARFPETRLQGRVLGYNKNVPISILQEVAREIMATLETTSSDSPLKWRLKDLVRNKLTPAGTLEELYYFWDALRESIVAHPNCPKSLRS